MVCRVAVRGYVSPLRHWDEILYLGHSISHECLPTAMKFGEPANDHLRVRPRKIAVGGRSMSCEVKRRSLAVSSAPQSSSLGTDRVLRGATLVMEVTKDMVVEASS